MFDLRSIPERIAAPGDLVVAVPAGIIGYSLDAVLNVVGVMEPGVVGGLSMAGALSAKKGAEAGWTRAKQRRRRKRLIAKVGDLRALVVADGRADLAERLDRVLATHEIYGDEDRLVRQLEDIVNAYERGAPAEPEIAGATTGSPG